MNLVVGSLTAEAADTRHGHQGFLNNQAVDSGHLIVTIFNGYTGRADDNDAQGNHLVTHALTGEGFDASEDGTGRGTPIVAAPITASYAKQIDSSDRNGGPPNLIDGVRRLTPIECERLQAFPDGWTCLCQPLDAYRDNPDEAHMRCVCSDSPRYRSLGNAVTVSVVEWLGKRLSLVGAV